MLYDLPEGSYTVMGRTLATSMFLTFDGGDVNMIAVTVIGSGSPLNSAAATTLL
jgi:hypothetical protein